MKSWRSLIGSLPAVREQKLITDLLQPTLTIADRLRQRAASIESDGGGAHSTLDYEPAQFDLLLGDASELLDRCLALHREASELEIKWAQLQLEKQLHEQLDDIEHRLVAKRLGEAIHDAAMKGASTAATAFEGAEDALASGMTEEQRSIEATARASYESAKCQAEILAERRDALADYRGSLDLRLTEAGGAQNYLERFEQVFSLLVEDFEEAYRKIRVAYIGVAKLMNLVDLPRPIVSETGNPTFELIRWCRSTMRQLQSLADREATHESVIPLAKSYRFLPHGHDAPHSPSRPWPPLVSAADFTAAFRGAVGAVGRLSFTLKDDVQGHILERPRVAAIGLSFVPANPSDFRINGTRLIATVFPPAQRFGPHLQMPPSVRFGNVRSCGSGAAAYMVSGLAVRNLYPFGEWEIRLGPLAIADSGEQVPLSTLDIVDLRLHLELVGAGYPLDRVRVFVPPHVEHL